MKFNVFKYKEWLEKKRNIDHVNIDILIDQSGMDQLWKEGKIILKEWCDE